MMRGLCVSVLALCALSMVGCASREACTTLEARLCADLGSDCSDFRASHAFELLTPDPAKSGTRRLKQYIANLIVPERAQLCDTMGQEPNYHSALLPQARWRARLHRDPRTAGPAPVTHYVPPPMGASDYAMYLVPVVFALGAFAYSFVVRKRMGV